MTGFIILLITYFVPALILIGIIYAITNYFYTRTTYYDITHVPYLKMRRNIGRYGEYLTFKRLKYYENQGAKFLFNCYLPRDNGETTEIDVLMLHTSGIYVFESKNYSGWIFGDEKSKTWTQTLPRGRGRRAQKEHFLNPIMQNKTHIKWLKNTLGDERLICHSVIVFSERCKLKNINISSEDIFVVNREHIEWAVKQLERDNQNVLSAEQIDNFYNVLFPFTQVSDEDKEQHIQNIKQRLSQDVRDVEVKQEQSQLLYEDNICPWCGNKLVIRTNKKGVNAGWKFWGCSSFPNCRYVKQFDNQER